MGGAGLSGGPRWAAPHRRGGPFRAAIDGIGRVNRAPAVLTGVWIVTILVSLPLALSLREMIARHLGASLAADAAADAVNFDWMQEFSDQATGVGVTFKPTIIGFGAVLDNLSAFADRTERPAVIAGAAAVYIVLWIFLVGGIIDRLARDRPTRAHGFFSACGVYFFRFLRLAVVQLVVYGVLFGVLHAWLFDRLYPRLTHDVTVERTAFLVRLLMYAAFGVAVAACTVIFDYTKVRAVVEDRRSVIGAIGAALGFLKRHGWAAGGLFLVNFTLFAAFVVLYGLVAPGAGRPGPIMWLGFALGQLYVVARLWVKLVFWASETALFQSRLAHAGYVARPVPTWPDSPAADAIQS
jgi:hypothetical protein